jgi:hypothetical protein
MDELGGIMTRGMCPCRGSKPEPLTAQALNPSIQANITTEVKEPALSTSMLLLFVPYIHYDGLTLDI